MPAVRRRDVRWHLWCVYLRCLPGGDLERRGSYCLQRLPCRYLELDIRLEICERMRAMPDRNVRRAERAIERHSRMRSLSCRGVCAVRIHVTDAV